MGGYAVSLDAAHGLDNTGGFQCVPRYPDDTWGPSGTTCAPEVSTSSGSILRAGRDEVGGFTHVQVLPCGDLRVPAQGVHRSGVDPGMRRGRRQERVENVGRISGGIAGFGLTRGSPEWAATP